MSKAWRISFFSGRPSGWEEKRSSISRGDALQKSGVHFSQHKKTVVGDEDQIASVDANRSPPGRASMFEAMGDRIGFSSTPTLGRCLNLQPG